MKTRSCWLLAVVANSAVMLVLLFGAVCFSADPSRDIPVADAAVQVEQGSACCDDVSVQESTEPTVYFSDEFGTLGAAAWDVSGPAAVVTRTLTFEVPMAGTIADRNGLGTGFTHRLPGTGASIPKNDPQANLSLYPGQLTITSTHADIGAGWNLDAADMLGFKVPNSVTAELNVSATFRNVQLSEASDQLMIYIGADIHHIFRAGMHYYPGGGHTFELIQHLGDFDSASPSPGYFLEGDDIRVTIRRTHGTQGTRYDVTYTNLTDPSRSRTAGVMFDWLDTAAELYVGIVYHNNASEHNVYNPKTSRLDEFSYSPSTPPRTVGGSVGGLTGSGLVIQNNQGDDLAIAENGAFAFASRLYDDTTYSVRVKTQPSNPSQYCSVVNGTGQIDGANVSNIEVTCTNVEDLTTLTITKTVVGASPARDWRFTGSGDIGSFTITNTGGTVVFGYLVPGAYTITETVKFGYEVTVLCTDGSGGSHRVTVTLDVGQHVACEFTNTARLTPPYTEQPLVIGSGFNGYGEARAPGDASKDVIAISAAVGNHNLALKNDGTVVAWGANGDGQTDVPSDLSSVIDIAAGAYHSLVLRQDGTVIAWGGNGDGQSNVPAGLTDVMTVTAGFNQSYAITRSGTVVAWGANSGIPAGLTDVIAISTGCNHSLAVIGNGTVVAWGNNDYEQINIPTGLSDVKAVAASCGRSYALKSDGTVIGWGYGAEVPDGLGDIAAISAGHAFVLALKRDGTAVAWGQNDNGQTSVPAGLNDITAIAAGHSRGLALNKNGSVMAWGSNFAGEGEVPGGLKATTGIAVGGGYSLALQADGTVVAWGRDDAGQTNVPAELAGVSAIAASYAGHSLALKNDGTVVAWGNNNYQQSTVPTDLRDVIAVAAGSYRSLALRRDGSITAWGLNSNVPAGLSNVVKIAAGDSYYLALLGDGTVVGWGETEYGTPEVPPGLEDVIAIAVGAAHGLALKKDGTVAAWGWNDNGQTDVPSGLRDVVAIAAGHGHSLALRSDGTVVGWGSNEYGQASLAMCRRNVVAIAAGGSTSLALLSNNEPGYCLFLPAIQQLNKVESVGR